MKLSSGQFFGETSQSLTATGFRFTEKRYAAAARLPSHSHELAHFCFVLRGRYDENIGMRRFGRQPMSLAYYPADVTHAEHHHSDGRHLLIEIDHTRLRLVNEHGLSLGEPAMLGGELPFSLATRMYREFKERDAYTPLALESIGNELLIAASRNCTGRTDRRPPAWLRLVKDFLHEHYASPPGLYELAAAAGVHPTHLARVFRHFEGCTAGEYVRGIRIANARQKLLDLRLSLVEIGNECGFADQAHFTRVFKRATGMTPSAFRRAFAVR